MTLCCLFLRSNYILLTWIPAALKNKNKNPNWKRPSPQLKKSQLCEIPSSYFWWTNLALSLLLHMIQAPHLLRLVMLMMSSQLGEFLLHFLLCWIFLKQESDQLSIYFLVVILFTFTFIVGETALDFVSCFCCFTWSRNSNRPRRGQASRYHHCSTKTIPCLTACSISGFLSTTTVTVIFLNVPLHLTMQFFFSFLPSILMNALLGLFNWEAIFHHTPII